MEEYYRNISGEMILRDLLAADRTHLANERTLLAYLRTALTLFIGGVSFIQFFSTLLVKLIGWSFIPLSIIFVVLGFQRFYKMKLPLDVLKKQAVPVGSEPRSTA